MNEKERRYRNRAIQCVQDTVLKEQRRQFEACGGDLDAQYARYGNTASFFARVIEKGRVYEVGYPHCVCHMVASGRETSPEQCECSRQSILYILQTLKPNSKIEVETLETVLSGGEKCRFLVHVEEEHGD